MNSANLLNIDE